MSRGLGKVQRALLDLLGQCRTEHRPELWISIARYDLGLGEHLESRRRAAKRLADAGLIELTTAIDRDSRGARNTHLFARLPLTADEREDARQMRTEYRRHRRIWDNDRLPMDLREHHQKWILWYGAPHRVNRPEAQEIWLEFIDEKTGRIATWE